MNLGVVVRLVQNEFRIHCSSFPNKRSLLETNRHNTLGYPWIFINMSSVLKWVASAQYILCHYRPLFKSCSNNLKYQVSISPSKSAKATGTAKSIRIAHEFTVDWVDWVDSSIVDSLPEACGSPRKRPTMLLLEAVDRLWSDEAVYGSNLYVCSIRIRWLDWHGLTIACPILSRCLFWDGFKCSSNEDLHRLLRDQGQGWNRNLNGGLKGLGLLESHPVREPSLMVKVGWGLPWKATIMHSTTTSASRLLKCTHLKQRWGCLAQAINTVRLQNIQDW